MKYNDEPLLGFSVLRELIKSNNNIKIIEYMDHLWTLIKQGDIKISYDNNIDSITFFWFHDFYPVKVSEEQFKIFLDYSHKYNRIYLKIRRFLNSKTSII